MGLSSNFAEMIGHFSSRFAIPRVADVFLPPLHDGGPPDEEKFMALFLPGGATGISYVMIPAEEAAAYEALRRQDLIGTDPSALAYGFGSGEPVRDMLALASINAICQHVMNETDYQPDHVTDPTGLLSVEKGDRVGMVGLFSGLATRIQETGAELVVIERDERLIEDHPALPITLDATRLSSCNKVLCTAVTVLNNSLDEVLGHCSPDAFVSVIGPSAGYFPDPLFASGVDVVGGRVVTHSEAFLQRLIAGERWTDTTQKTCFQKRTYQSIMKVERAAEVRPHRADRRGTDVR